MTFDLKIIKPIQNKALRYLCQAVSLCPFPQTITKTVVFKVDAVYINNFVGLPIYLSI